MLIISDTYSTQQKEDHFSISSWVEMPCGAPMRANFRPNKFALFPAYMRDHSQRLFLAKNITTSLSFHLDVTLPYAHLAVIQHRG